MNLGPNKAGLCAGTLWPPGSTGPGSATCHARAPQTALSYCSSPILFFLLRKLPWICLVDCPVRDINSLLGLWAFISHEVVPLTSHYSSLITGPYRGTRDAPIPPRLSVSPHQGVAPEPLQGVADLRTGREVYPTSERPAWGSGSSGSPQGLHSPGVVGSIPTRRLQTISSSIQSARLSRVATSLHWIVRGGGRLSGSTGRA